MAAHRGRTLMSIGQAFGPLGNVDGSFTPGVQGQPVMHRMQGIPTMSGYRDRPPKWNFSLPEIKIPWPVFLKPVRG